MSKTATLQTTSRDASSPSSGHLLQRACACGGVAGLAGECEECKTKKLLGKPLQTKLTISQPGDEFEQEADRVAEQVMRMPDAELNRQRRDIGTPLVQRRATSGGTGVMEAPPIVHDVLSSPGQPLDTATRAFFEPRFGHDLGQVRIHNDQRAADSSRAVDALAYTVGNALVFASGRYAPATAGGRQLLAHEFAHVVQQQPFGPDPIVQRSTGEPTKTDTDSQASQAKELLATQQIVIAGETFNLVEMADYSAPGSSAWRYRERAQEYLSVYPNLANGLWALIVRPRDGVPSDIGGNCLGWTIGNYGLIDPPQEVWGLASSYLDSIDHSVRGHKSAQETYLKLVEKQKIASPALWDHYMAQQFEAASVASSGEANLALYGTGFGGPMDGPTHIAFRTAGGELWVSKPSPSKPPILHQTAMQMSGGQNGAVVRLYARTGGPPNQVSLRRTQGQGSPSP